MGGVPAAAVWLARAPTGEVACFDERRAGNGRAMPRGARPLLCGALGGTVGTAAMSAVMLSSQRLGLMGQQPPQKIAEAALAKAGAEGVTEDEENLLATVAHFGFGASMGALFGLLHHRARPSVPPAATGLAFGLAVWALAYKGVVPALGIMPPPERDRRGRPGSMVLGHLVWGAATGLVVGRLSQESSTTRPKAPSSRRRPALGRGGRTGRRAAAGRGRWRGAGAVH